MVFIALLNFFLSLFTATVVNEKPSIISPPKGEDLQLHFGERLVWCVSGGSLGVNDLQWAWSQDPRLKTVNISASVSEPSPCLNCECASTAYYNSTVVQEHLQNMTVGGARGVAFSVIGYKFHVSRLTRSWQCSGVPTSFLSFVIIDEVRPSDNLTKVMFDVTSFSGDVTSGGYSIQACMFIFMFVCVCVCVHVSYYPTEHSHERKRGAMEREYVSKVEGGGGSERDKEGDGKKLQESDWYCTTVNTELLPIH